MPKNNLLDKEKSQEEILQEVADANRENARFLKTIQKRIIELDLEYASLLLAKKALALKILKRRN